jgi:hypothetical protein
LLALILISSEIFAPKSSDFEGSHTTQAVCPARFWSLAKIVNVVF